MAARLVRDAAALGLGRFEAARVEAQLIALGREAFGAAGVGVVRLEARPGGVLVPATRPIGVEPATWRAVIADVRHPGPGTAPGVKRAGVDAFEAARTQAHAAGADEALLFDAADRLVEGARTNLFVACAEGDWTRPDPARVAVNAVRGARPIVVLDGRAVGNGAPGPLAAALHAALAAAP